MRRLMADKPVLPSFLGWYLLRHVQRVIGASFDAIAPISALAGAAVARKNDTTVAFSEAERLLAVWRLLAVDADHDLGSTLELHALALVDFLRSACSLNPSNLAATAGGAAAASAHVTRATFSHLIFRRTER